MGDGLRHLERWGYVLHACQQPLDEFDYGVGCLREDLRSGVRLAALYEALTGKRMLVCVCLCEWAVGGRGKWREGMAVGSIQTRPA
jgi:hypothetical protein